MIEEMLREMINNRTWLVEEYQEMERQSGFDYSDKLKDIECQIRLLEQLLENIEQGYTELDEEFDSLKQTWKEDYAEFITRDR